VSAEHDKAGTDFDGEIGDFMKRPAVPHVAILDANLDRKLLSTLSFNRRPISSSVIVFGVNVISEKYSSPA